MAGLPPDGEWLVQKIGDNVILFNRYTEEEIIKVPASDGNALAQAQMKIAMDPGLTSEQKCFAHFWCGYFYAHATGL